MASLLKNPKQPWLKFYPSDWRADQALRICSLAARGLWMECLCVMHEAEPYGHLVVNGKPVTDTHLAMLAGTSSDEAARLLAELDAAGVFSRNRDGLIYSRRLTRDLKMARNAQQNGSKGGNPTLSNTRLIPPPVNPEDKATLKAGDKAQKPEARKNPPSPPSSKRVALLDDIDLGALEEWARIEAPNANVRREMTKAQIWTKSKGRKHLDAFAFMQKWLIKASDEAGPVPASDADVAGPKLIPKGSVAHEAVELALKRFDKAKAMEFHNAYQRDPAEAERLAQAYLKAAA